jgi:hypothetical protein
MRFTISPPQTHTQIHLEVHQFYRERCLWASSLSFRLEFVEGEQMVKHNLTKDTREQVVIGVYFKGTIGELYFYVIGSLDGKSIEVMYDGYQEPVLERHVYKIKNDNGEKLVKK